MRKATLLVLTVLMMMVSVPAFTAEKTQQQKDECLLASKNCMDRVYTIQEKIKRLNTEIKKGTRVYTPQELDKLNKKLKETEDMVDNMLMGGQ